MFFALSAFAICVAQLTQASRGCGHTRSACNSSLPLRLCASAPLQPSTSAPTAPLHLRLRPSHEVSLKIRGLDPSQLCTRCLCLAVNFPPGRGKPPSSSTQDSRLCELSRREETVGASAPLPPLPPSKAFFKFSERKRMFNEDPQYLCGLSRR